MPDCFHRLFWLSYVSPDGFEGYGEGESTVRQCVECEQNHALGGDGIDEDEEEEEDDEDPKAAAIALLAEEVARNPKPSSSAA
jgi:hypothetical protein